MSHVLHVAFFGFNFVHSASVCVCLVLLLLFASRFVLGIIKSIFFHCHDRTCEHQHNKNQAIAFPLEKKATERLNTITLKLGEVYSCANSTILPTECPYSRMTNNPM